MPFGNVKIRNIQQTIKKVINCVKESNQGHLKIRFRSESHKMSSDTAEEEEKTVHYQWSIFNLLPGMLHAYICVPYLFFKTN